MHYNYMISIYLDTNFLLKYNKNNKIYLGGIPMERIEFGEIIEVENGQEYICFSKIEENGKYYVMLLSNFKPLVVKFAEEIVDGDNILLQLVEDPELKAHLVEVFKSISNIG